MRLHPTIGTITGSQSAVPKGLEDDKAGSGVLGEYRMDGAERCHRAAEVEYEENGVVGWPENSFAKAKYAAERVVKDLLISS